ncbi:MAG: hypothetical protein J7J87_04750 [Candidatus Diapherotrites archaeon]|nr:hypothetical protein [Candidatus Diapherotrites archaeon]
MGAHTPNNVEEQCKSYKKIDTEFVEYWQERYDNIWHDEEKYKGLLKDVKKEVKSQKCISKKPLLKFTNGRLLEHFIT